MHPHTKKVVMMTAISLSIIIFAFIIPVYVIPVALAISEAASCTDYGCANAAFSKCGGFSSEQDSSDFMSSWTEGMEGMMCMMGIDTKSSDNTSGRQITLNKV
jgi:hypothetical protein